MARGKKKESTLTPEEKLAQALVPVEEQPYKVPENWCWTRLAHVAKWGSGGTPSRKNPEYYEGIIPWVKTGELNDDYIYETEEHISDEAVANSSAKLFPINTVAIAMYGATIGKVGVLGIEATTNQACACAVTTSVINYRYLFRYAQSQKDAFIKKGKGGAQPNISQEIIKEHEIPLPPLSEQQRIVDRIEYLFAKLDEAKEKSQSVLDSFETRKAAILHKAFTGELTAKWRAEHSVGMDSWEHLTYSDIGSSKLGKMLDEAKNEGLPTPYLRNINVRWFTFDLNDVSTMLASEAEIEALSVKKGDLFICEGGEPGRCAIWKEPDSNLIFQKALHRFRPNKKVISEFLCYNLYFMSLSGALEGYFTGTTIKHLTGQSLSKLPVHLPYVSEQTEIVRILDSLFAKEQQAQEAAEAVLEKIDLLKKSILARAFRGELGTNDPSEESAIELLKKIL